MVQPRLHAIGLALALGLAFVPAVGNGEVVFGNLGPTGVRDLDETSTDITARRLAAGFTTGSATSTRRLSSITLGLFYSESLPPIPVSIAVHNDDNGIPGTVAFNSQPTSVGDVALYVFSFENPQLGADTTYWILPPQGLSWYLADPAESPVPYNDSGFASNGYLRLNSAGTAWASPGLNYSLSVVAVPEQGTLPLAGIGLVGAGWAVRRMKRRSAAENVASEAVNDAGA